MAVTGNGNGTIKEGSNKGPHEAGNALGNASKELEGERDGVDVGAVIGDDGQCEDDKAELSESAQGRDDNGSEKSTDARGMVSVYVDIVTLIGSHCSRDRCTEHLREKEREGETGVSPDENRFSGSADRLIDGVISSI